MIRTALILLISIITGCESRDENASTTQSTQGFEAGVANRGYMEFDKDRFWTRRVEEVEGVTSGDTLPVKFFVSRYVELQYLQDVTEELDNDTYRKLKAIRPLTEDAGDEGESLIEYFSVRQGDNPGRELFTSIAKSNRMDLGDREYEAKMNKIFQEAGRLGLTIIAVRGHDSRDKLVPNQGEKRTMRVIIPYRSAYPHLYLQEAIVAKLFEKAMPRRVDEPDPMFLVKGIDFDQALKVVTDKKRSVFSFKRDLKTKPMRSIRLENATLSRQVQGEEETRVWFAPEDLQLDLIEHPEGVILK